MVKVRSLALQVILFVILMLGAVAALASPAPQTSGDPCADGGCPAAFSS